MMKGNIYYVIFFFISKRRKKFRKRKKKFLYFFLNFIFFYFLESNNLHLFEFPDLEDIHISTIVNYLRDHLHNSPRRLSRV